MEIYEIIGEILATFFVATVVYLAPKVKNWLSAKTDESTMNAILVLVTSFAEAAEQLLHDDDPTGEKRKEYVIERLKEANVLIDSSVLSMIEGVVFEINNSIDMANI